MLLPAVRHELSFWHGAGRLVGDLVLPETDGPHPVLLVVGEPDATERDRSCWLDGLAEAGIASFTWDRELPEPGSHDPVRRVTDQAREVLAVMDRLRYLPELDSEAIGLVGWGEGGWAAAQAATFSSHVRALVLAGTPTAVPAQLEEHRLVQHLRAAGHAGSDVATARDVVRCRLEALLAGRTLSNEDVLAAHRNEPWYETLQAVGGFTGPALAELTANPLPTLSAVTVPVLALFGEQDPTLPLEESVRGVRKVLREAGHRDYQVAVIRGGDHALRVRPSHGLGHLIDGRHQFGEWPAGLTAVLVDWLDVRISGRDDLPVYPPPTVPTVQAGSCPLLPVRQVRRRVNH